MAVRARDIMTKRVVTVGPGMKVRELAKLLAQKKISGAPVVDEKDSLVGIATEADILKRKAGQNTVKSIMSSRVSTVSEDTSLEEIASVLAGRKFKRVPVVRGDRLVGIVSRADVVRAIARR